MNAASACWRAEDAQAIFVTEALEGNDAIFLATHTPIEGFDVAGRDAGQIAQADERSVLEALAAPDREHAFCVVQGEPGSGKSHLIRWISVNWPDANDIKLLLRRADGSLEGALGQLRSRLPEEFAPLFENLGQRQKATEQGRAKIFMSTIGVLQAILNPNLQQPEALDSGSYPSGLIEPDAFRSDRRSDRALALPLERIVENRLEEASERTRMRRVLSYWGTPDRATTTAAGEELAFAGVRRSLFDAFSLPWLGADQAGVEPTAPAKIDMPVIAESEVVTHAPVDEGQGAFPPTTQVLSVTPPEPKPNVPAKPKRIRASTTEIEGLFEQIRSWNETGTMQAGQKWNAFVHQLVASLDARNLGVPRPLFDRLLTSEMVKLQGTTSRPLD